MAPKLMEARIDVVVKDLRSDISLCQVLNKILRACCRGRCGRGGRCIAWVAHGGLQRVTDDK
jgi:hypothetical protein